MRRAGFVILLTLCAPAGCDTKAQPDPEADKAAPVRQKEAAEARVEGTQEAMEQRHDRILDQSMGEDGTVPER